MKMEQQHELVENPTRHFISVHNVVVSVLDRGIFAAHSSPSCIRSHGSNPALVKKFNRGHRNCLWKNSTPPFSHIARGVCVCASTLSPPVRLEPRVMSTFLVDFCRVERGQTQPGVFLTLCSGRKRSTNHSVRATTHKTKQTDTHTNSSPFWAFPFYRQEISQGLGISKGSKGYE